ncbi:MAG: ABC transporter ATP-binding protein [Fimbriimonadaceae bacterium]
MEAGTNAVEISNLTRTFGSKRALDNVELTVPAGSVMGLVGENGAGKTTLIKHVMGLLRPQAGTVRVLGEDPIDDPRGVLSRVGYLTEEVDLPAWMRVHELMRYTQSFYGTWDAAYAERLRLEFGLDLGAKLRTLSKGQRARAGLMVALAYRPELLVLDEPSSGLDPIVRRDILGAIIRTIADEGRTVLFSSHLLAEVEQVSDRVAMIRTGRIVFSDTIDAIKESHFRITLRLDEPASAPPRMAGALNWEGEGCEWTTVWCGEATQIEAAVAVTGGRIVDQAYPSLDDIFVARVGAPAAVENR